MISQEIRRNFLKYFKNHGHRILPSASVIPHNDPTLLFNNAGMNQFKDVFLGKDKRDYTRAATSQKCIRAGGKHNDFENVGHTSRHLTFFEMLGNFSFGDYFKKDAIKFAWEISIEIFGLEENKIWASVFKDDDEAFSLWENYLPKDKIVRFDEKENFWAMGDTGPCGPCSELLYDRGEKFSNAKNPYEDFTGERFLEYWNLVFMEFNKDANGIMMPLPKKSIDTGGGLERIVSLKMGVDSIFMTDILRSLIAEMENISKIKYVETDKILAPSFNVIADHIRTLSFSIADGAQPSNVERGYILRKILRRAVRYGKTLGMKKPFLHLLVPRLIELMGDDYPELSKSKNKICEILTLEEENFLKTLKRGGNLLFEIIKESKETDKKEISGVDAFKLKDTYGFPLDEIMVIAKDENLEVDLNKFNDLEEEAKEKSKKARKVKPETLDTSKKLYKDLLEKFSKTEFIGYDRHTASGKILAIIKDGKLVDKIVKGDFAEIILDKTIFYAEKGGQEADFGNLEIENVGNFKVKNTKSPISDLVCHIGWVEEGEISKDLKVLEKIDVNRRRNIERNHTATHLLHWALAKVLGEHIKQAGSQVSDKYFRLDFNHHKAITEDDIKNIELLVNEKIRENKKVSSYEKDFEEIQFENDIKMLFGEKYGKNVRVVDIDYSKELCGGCHVEYTGDIGLFKIVKEGSIASGVRRIEAKTAIFAENLVYEKDFLIKDISKKLKIDKSKLLFSLDHVLFENKNLKNEIKVLKQEKLKKLSKDLLKNTILEKESHFIFINEKLSQPDIMELINLITNEIKSYLIVVTSKINDKSFVVIKVSDDLIKKDIFANNLIKKISPLIQGGGGGKKDLAQAGGNDFSKFDKIKDEILKYFRETC